MAGYSSKTLAAKLGLTALKAGVPARVVDAPETLMRQARAECPDVVLESQSFNLKIPPSVFLWCFCSLESELKAVMPRLRKALADDGQLWISWPKKTSWKTMGLHPSGAITEDAIRKHAFPQGLVDIKVCAVDEIWSGLKLVVRRENRRVKKEPRRPLKELAEL
jgi:hypothetical protein